MLRSLGIYRALIGAGFRAEMQYRGNLLLMLCAGFAYQGVGLAFITVVVSRFGSLAGWTLGEIVFLYALRMCAHGLWVAPFSQLNQLDLVVREGEFDRFLVRPANPLVQLLTRRLGLMQMGDLVGGIALLVYAGTLVDISWSPSSVAFLLLAVCGGALVEVSVQLAISSLAFRMLSMRTLKIQVDQTFNSYGNYPMRIFPTVARFVFTFVVPMAFVAYLPATVLLSRTDELSVAPWLAYVSPLVGVLLFAGAYQLFKHQTKHYSSAGS